MKWPHPLPPRRRAVRGVALLAAVLLGVASPAGAQQIVTPDQPTPIMPLEEVRIGMKGYGLTVFSGNRIEPFAVEVVSVAHNRVPKQDAIWIECPDDRMQTSGPVQGMSGSPIYLWDEGEPQVPGEGGRLIGAFAFGYSNSKGCYAGVQPIEYMRQIATRAGADAQADRGHGSAEAAARVARQTLGRLAQLADAQSLPASQRVRLDALHRVVAGPDPASPAPLAPAEHPNALRLPLALPSAELAELLDPIMAPLGLTTVAASGATAGQPPPGVNPRDTDIRPGSVLSLPLAYGDIQLAASGTTTEVLPDGSVLGFGHPMLGNGATAMPLATGYVHFVVPRTTISFKFGGSMSVVGSIVRDESPGISGRSGQTYTTAPVSIRVAVPGQEPEQFNFELVNHPLYAAGLTGALVSSAATARQGFPLENTVWLRGHLVFEGGRDIAVDTVMANASAQALVFEVLPIVSTMAQNPHQTLEFESIDLSVEVDREVRTATIQAARLQRNAVAPGETAVIWVELVPYGAEPYLERIELAIPADTPEGDYPLLIADTARYTRQWLASRQHLMRTESVDDVADLVQRIVSIPTDAIHAVMQLPQQGVAVGRRELPGLPSSQRAVLATPSSTLAVPFDQTLETAVSTGRVIEGDALLTLSVRRPGPPASTQRNRN